jgi:hypothetical protein
MGWADDATRRPKGEVALSTLLIRRRDAKLPEIFGRRQAHEAACWAQMDGDGLPVSQQAAHIRKRAPTLAIPEHKAIGRIAGHLYVFSGVEIKAVGAFWRLDMPNLPIPDIVAKGPSDGVDHHAMVPPIC